MLEKEEKHIKVYPNGATLVYCKQNTSNTTDVAMGFICGSNRDGNKKGLAHALEHSLFNGTNDMTRDEIHKVLLDTNTDHHGYTNDNFIISTFCCPNPFVEKIIKLNSDMWSCNKYDEHEWKRERKIILQELNIAIDRNDVCDTLGSPITLSKITTQDFIDYKKNNFFTNNMLICVISSLPYNQIKGYFEKYFISKFPTDARKKLAIKPRHYQLKDELTILDTPDYNSFEIRLLFQGLYDNDKNAIYEEFENWYFDGADGKLYENLRLKAPLSYSLGFGSYLQDRSDCHIKEFAVITSPKNVQKCIDILCDTIYNLSTNGITDVEFASFKKAMLAKREGKVSAKYDDALDLVLNYTYNNKRPFEVDYFDKVMALTKEDINKYLKTVYKKSNVELRLIGDTAEAQNEIRNNPCYVLTENGLTIISDNLSIFTH